MDTPITLSSTLSSINKPSKKSAAHRSGSSVARVPVSWDSPPKPYDRESSCTPTTLQKVNNWINSLNRLNRCNVESHGNSHKPNSVFNEFENELDMEGDFLHSMMVSEDKMIEDELHQYCGVTYGSYEKPKGSQSTPKIPGDTLHGGGVRKHSHPKAIKRRKPVQTTNLVEREIDMSDDSDSNIPSSPESEKKKELCSYLQLMKPTDKKTVMILQNRRSVRVKNLSLMQEKKELEKKLKEEHVEDANDHTILQFPSLHSFVEINVECEDKRHKWLKYNRTRDSVSEPFHFPPPKDDLKDNVTDFDDVTHEDWFKDWKEQRELVTKEELNEDCGIGKTRLGSKRMCVIHQESIGNDKNVKLKKKEDRVSAKKFEEQKNRTHIAEGDTNQKIHKLPNGLRNKQDKNGFKEKPKESPKKISQHVSQVSETDHFSMPKPSLHLAIGICDFGEVIQENRDLIKDDITSFELKLPASETQLLNNVKTAVSPPKKDKKSLTRDICVFQDVIKDNKELNKDNFVSVDGKISDSENTLSSPVKSVKVFPLKKKKKIKKSKKMHSLRRSSSFKIKLVSKRKNSQSPSKGNKSSVRSISDNLQTTLKCRPMKAKIGLNMTKKENLKKKIRAIKEDKGVTELPPKSPLKDTNKNPLQSEDIEPSISVDQKALHSDVKSPKTGNLTSISTDGKLDSPSRSPKTKLITKKKSENREKTPPSAIMAIFKDQTNGISDLGPNILQPDATVAEEKGEFYSQIMDVEQDSEEDEAVGNGQRISIIEMLSFPKNNEVQFSHSPTGRDSPSMKSVSASKECSTPVSSREGMPQIDISIKSAPFISFKKNSVINPLHRCLNASKQKGVKSNLEEVHSPTNWVSSSPSHKQKKDQHSIHISRDDGPVLKIFYMEYNLVLCQESLVSFWTQTALGNVLGAQNMWINKGSVQRLSMNRNCLFKESLEMVVSTENNVAYIELWTKEHQSDKREGPVADVFATVYFWKKGHNGLDKKVLQLENINGFADDVQYSVLKSSPKIVVSWHLATNELERKKTFIHCYQLATDFQSVCNISEFEAVEHYVSSLHNIEGCDTLIMGCGEHKITLWNIELGYVAATIEMLEIKSPLSTLWVKCDRGFLFTLQQCVDRELRLIAIHGMNHSWKKLASYVPPEDYDRLKGVFVENGIVLAFYEQGIICWNAQTSEIVLEASQNEAEYISGKYIISVVNDQVNLRHAITYLLSAEES